VGYLDDPRLCYDYHKREHGTVSADTKREPFRWVSEVAYKNVHRIVARGYDTTELVEKGYGFADVVFIDFQSRIPTIEEHQMLNYVMIMGFEDGLSAPAAITRLVAQSNTFLTQAVGASILAFGHAYGGYCAFGQRLDEYLARAEKEGKTAAQMAEALVRENLKSESLGVSNLMLKDPAAKRTIARAEKLGVAGKYVAFMKEIVSAAGKVSPEPVDLDMLGAIGSTMMDLGFTPEATWAILAISRAFACGAHFCEEIEREGYVRLGQTLTPKENYDGPPDRPVPGKGQRAKAAKGAQVKTPEEWRKAFDERQKMLGTGWSIVEEIDLPEPKKEAE